MPSTDGTVWKSLGTHLLEKAKVRLAVEATEFELAIAKCRRDRASSVAGVQAAKAIVAATAPDEHSNASAEPTDPLAILRAVEESLERLRQLAASAQPQRHGVQPLAEEPRPTSKPQSAPRPTATPNPAADAKAPAKRGLRPTLLHLFEDWKLKQTKHRTISAVQTAVMEFRTLTGPLAVEDITRRRLSNGTIENRIGFLSTLVRHGRAELDEHLTGNPFENLVFSGGQVLRAEKERRVYDAAELNLVYSTRLYTEGYRPKGQVAEAAYWAPLLAPFVGARIEEIAQLRVPDVQRINGVWCIRICDLGESQSVKNVGSFRRVPLHETVVRCGFLAYVARQARAGHERAFPSPMSPSWHCSALRP